MENNELIERISQIESRLEKLEENKTNEQKVLQETADLNVGKLKYGGKYESPNRNIRANFAGEVSIDKILKTNSKDLAQVIDAFSSEERLDIVKLLLKKSLSAKEIMDILNFPTTGKVYHHLSFLEKLGIIKKYDDKFSISAKYVQCVVFIMLGVYEILKDRG